MISSIAPSRWSAHSSQSNHTTGSVESISRTRLRNKAKAQGLNIRKVAMRKITEAERQRVEKDQAQEIDRLKKMTQMELDETKEKMKMELEAFKKHRAME